VKISSKLRAIPFPNDEFLKGPFSPPVYMCNRAVLPPKIDGDMFKPFWDAAPRTMAFHDIEGACRPAPKHETWAKLLWDEENLYLGAVLYGDEIWAYVKERDDIIFQDNDFEFFLDKDGSTHNYFELEINALNTLWDLLLPKPYRDGGNAIDGFDYKGIVSAVKIDGELNNPKAKNAYWSVEMMIPWKGIAKHGAASEPPKVGDYHRLNFSRVQWRAEVKDGQWQRVINPETGHPYPEDNWVYAPTGVVNIHYPELWAFLVYADENTPTFEIPEVEKIKWELRKVYYAQRAYYEANGCFNNEPMVESPYKIIVETTTNMFQAYIKHEGLQINIAQDGYAWVEKN